MTLQELRALYAPCPKGTRPTEAERREQRRELRRRFGAGPLARLKGEVAKRERELKESGP